MVYPWSRQASHLISIEPRTQLRIQPTALESNERQGGGVARYLRACDLFKLYPHAVGGNLDLWLAIVRCKENEPWSASLHENASTKQWTIKTPCVYIYVHTSYPGIHMYLRSHKYLSLYKMSVLRLSLSQCNTPSMPLGLNGREKWVRKHWQMLITKLSRLAGWLGGTSLTTSVCSQDSTMEGETWLPKVFLLPPYVQHTHTQTNSK